MQYPKNVRSQSKPGTFRLLSDPEGDFRKISPDYLRERAGGEFWASSLWAVIGAHLSVCSAWVAHREGYVAAILIAVLACLCWRRCAIHARRAADFLSH